MADTAVPPPLELRVLSRMRHRFHCPGTCPCLVDERGISSMARTAASAGLEGVEGGADAKVDVNGLTGKSEVEDGLAEFGGEVEEGGLELLRGW